MSKRKRHHTSPQVSGYSEAGASLDRRAMKGFIPNSGSPRDDIDSNNMTLRQRSRMLYMSSPIATAAINTNRTKVIGVGLALKSAVNYEVLGITPEDAKIWQRKAEAEFRMWAEKKQNCDAMGMNNFDGLQQLALKSCLLSGDVFPVFKRYAPTPDNPYSLRIHLVEADRISTPYEYGGTFTGSGYTEGRVPEGKPGAGRKIYDGVEIDGNGQVTAYYIRNTYPFQYIADEPPKWQRVEAYGTKTHLPNILHVMDAERPDQYRGVPYLAPVIESLLQLRRYTESELMAAIVQSFFTAWIVTKSDPNTIPLSVVGDGVPAGTADTNDSEYNNAENENENEYQMGPGTVAHLEEGEDIKFGNPTIPTAGFETFVKTTCKLVGAALELPYDVLMKEFNSSYSASRGALMEAYEAFKMRRHWFADDFCQPVYEMFLTEAVARGRINAPGFFSDPLLRAAWCAARWIGPVQGQIDPLKEAKSAILLADRGIKTHQQIAREMGGGDWLENIEQLRQENKLLEEAAFGTEYGAIMQEPDEEEPEEPDGEEKG